MVQNDKKLRIGVLGAPVGVKGLIRFKSFLADLSSLNSFQNLYGPDQDTLFPKITLIEEKSSSLGVCKIQGVTTRNQAEGLKNTPLFIERSALPLLQDATFFYHADLIGLKVYATSSNTCLGKVIYVQDFGAGPLLEILPTHDKETIFVPFQEQFVPRIELEKARLEITDPFLSLFTAMEDPS